MVNKGKLLFEWMMIIFIEDACFNTTPQACSFELILCINKGCMYVCSNLQAPVVQTSDSAIHRINLYPENKYYGNQSRYPLDSDLSGG